MDECIYDLIEPPAPARKKKVVYRSKYPGDLPPTSSTFGSVLTSNVCGPSNVGGQMDWHTTRDHKQSGFNWGPAVKAERSMIHQGKGTTNLPKPQKFSRTIAKKKPEIPKAKETHVISGLKSTANYVSINAINNILMEPRNRAEDAPNSIYKHENFGKVPGYLQKNKELIKNEQELINAELQKTQIEDNKNKATLLPEEDRQLVLQRLKERWEEVNKEYQAMTHLVILDTVGKVRRKERFESTLAQLEKDIQLLSKKNVYINNE